MKEKDSKLVALALILSVIDFLARSGNVFQRSYFGTNPLLFLLIYLTFASYLISQLFKFKKWALSAYFIFSFFNICIYLLTEANNLRFPGIIGGILGYNFIIFFTVIVLVIKRKHFNN